MLYKNVAPGIHRVEHSYTNFYIVEDEGRLGLIDTGLPESWSSLIDALEELGFKLSAISAIAITHGHFDHMGFAKKAQEELGVPLWIHREDAHLAKHPYQYDHENSRLPYPLLHPSSIPLNISMVKAGALRVDGVDGALLFDNTTDTLDFPGAPQVIPLPGHTNGECAFFFPERNALVTGDALVTLNIYTGETGPQIIAGAATADSELALQSLDALIPMDTSVMLPGHGEPWSEGVEKAVELARQKGAS